MVSKSIMFWIDNLILLSSIVVITFLLYQLTSKTQICNRENQLLFTIISDNSQFRIIDSYQDHSFLKEFGEYSYNRSVDKLIICRV